MVEQTRSSGCIDAGLASSAGFTFSNQEKETTTGVCVPAAHAQTVGMEHAAAAEEIQPKRIKNRRREADAVMIGLLREIRMWCGQELLLCGRADVGAVRGNDAYMRRPRRQRRRVRRFSKIEEWENFLHPY